MTSARRRGVMCSAAAEKGMVIASKHASARHQERGLEPMTRFRLMIRATSSTIPWLRAALPKFSRTPFLRNDGRAVDHLASRCPWNSPYQSRRQGRASCGRLPVDDACNHRTERSSSGAGVSYRDKQPSPRSGASLLIGRTAEAAPSRPIVAKLRGAGLSAPVI
jgi:hypothetical protein